MFLEGFDSDIGALTIDLVPAFQRTHSMRHHHDSKVSLVLANKTRAPCTVGHWRAQPGAREGHGRRARGTGPVVARAARV